MPLQSDKLVTMRIRSNSPVREFVSEERLDFLRHATEAVERILPHTELSTWQQKEWQESGAILTSIRRDEIKIVLSVGVKENESARSFVSFLKRKQVPREVRGIPRTFDKREHQICKTVVEIASKVLQQDSSSEPLLLKAFQEKFDEQVIAQHIKEFHNLRLDVAPVLRIFHELSEQTYENKRFSFGCLLDSRRHKEQGGVKFLGHLIDLEGGAKRYRALSDGFKTVYRIATDGFLLRFDDIEHHDHPLKKAHYPEWSEPIAAASRDGVIGMSLNRNGDILIFDEGSLRFTYRFGRWQYWNHSHLVQLLKRLSPAQRVPVQVKSKVAHAIYRAALDAAFRRRGALFVVLRARKFRHNVVRIGDAIGDTKRHFADKGFDLSLPGKSIQSIPRSVILELASLDGAVVVDNSGKLMAYGAVLLTQKGRRSTKGRREEEGSRTKAAIGASKHGLAVKVSSDGGITIFCNGDSFIEV